MGGQEYDTRWRVRVGTRGGKSGSFRQGSFTFEGTPVQRKKAIELQKAWGDKSCPHPAFSREYDSGERTGNYCCTQCGAILSFREKAEITASRGSPSDGS